MCLWEERQVVGKKERRQKAQTNGILKRVESWRERDWREVEGKRPRSPGVYREEDTFLRTLTF